MSEYHIDRRSDTWRLGFNSAVAGWADIPPAGVDPTLWLSGWQMGRDAHLKARSQLKDAWQTFCVQHRVPVIIPDVLS